MAVTMERSPSVFLRIKEEEVRDILLVSLNGIFVEFEDEESQEIAGTLGHAATRDPPDLAARCQRTPVDATSISATLSSQLRCGKRFERALVIASFTMGWRMAHWYWNTLFSYCSAY